SAYAGQRRDTRQLCHLPVCWQYAVLFWPLPTLHYPSQHRCSGPGPGFSCRLFLHLPASAGGTEQNPSGREPWLLQQLQDAINTHYRHLHTAGEYADLLRVPARSLTRLVKSHYQKTLSQLITERIIMEAKRELYLTSQSVKAIAFALGFGDEYYFSRFFKKNTAVSPQFFRESVGFAKAEES
nr:hypothetical protein [Tanacetum cinerariifolium]